jgi:hypothetical protein
MQGSLIYKSRHLNRNAAVQPLFAFQVQYK